MGGGRGYIRIKQTSVFDAVFLKNKNGIPKSIG